MIGIPYAYVLLVARDEQGRWYQVRECPVCKDHVRELIDADSKPIAPGYAEHYTEAHA